MTKGSLPTKLAVGHNVCSSAGVVVSRTASRGPRQFAGEKLERMQENGQKKDQTPNGRALTVDLPSELLIEICSHLRPSDVFVMSSTSKALRKRILDLDSPISKAIIKRRYAVLAKCFPLPTLIKHEDQSTHSALLSKDEQMKLIRDKGLYPHIQLSDQKLVCTCLPCSLAWNYLCLIVDFTVSQYYIIHEIHTKILHRFHHSKWNRKLMADNAAVVERALQSSLWYARILEQHLLSKVYYTLAKHKSMTRSFSFRMRLEDNYFATDASLEGIRLVYNEANSDILEACLPDGAWLAKQQKWMHIPSPQEEASLPPQEEGDFICITEWWEAIESESA